MKASSSTKTESRSVVDVGLFRCTNTICESLIKVFGAVYVYRASGDFLYVFLFILIFESVELLCSRFCINLFANHPKLALVLRIVPFLLMYIAFYLEGWSLWFLVIVGITEGLTNSFYFCPMDVFNGSLKSVGNKLKGQSIILAFENIGKILVTIVSGLLIDSGKTKLLALIGIVIYTALTISFIFFYKEPDYFKHDNYEKNQPLMRPTIAITKSTFVARLKNFNPFKKYYPWLAEGLMGLYTVIKIIWAAYLYTYVKAFLMVGILRGLGAVFAIAGCFVINKVSKNKKWGVLASLALVGVCSMWVLRALSTQNVIFMVCSAIVGFLEPFYLIPMNSTYYKYSQGMRSTAKTLAKKDFYRKLFTVPATLVCMLIWQPNFAIIFMAIIMLFAIIQIVPASKAQFETQNQNYAIKLSATRKSKMFVARNNYEGKYFSASTNHISNGENHNDKIDNVQ